MKASGVNLISEKIDRMLKTENTAMASARIMLIRRIAGYGSSLRFFALPSLAWSNIFKIILIIIRSLR